MQELYRNYVQASRPVVLRGAARAWPAYNLWQVCAIRARLLEGQSLRRLVLG